MLKTRFVVMAVASLAAVSCSKQVAPAQPTPVEGAQAQSVLALPFEVPEGAQYVVRTRGSGNLHRIQETCRPLQAMNPSTVVFFWTLEAGIRAGHRLTKEEGCR